MANISQIKLPDNTVYNIRDAGALRTITSSNVTTALGYTPLNSSLKGASNGVAELDANGKVPSSQLPSYVDDVVEYAKLSSFPTTGVAGKIYIAQDTNKTYRWSGTAYVEISASLALGTTSSTAYRGDYGNAAYAHAVTNKGSAFTSGLYKITTNSEGHVTAATAVAKSDITGLGIPGSDTNTHRPIQVNGTQILGDNTTALNLKAGSNVSVTNSSGTVTIAATDTKYTAATAAPGNIATSGAQGSSTNYARQDHTHGISLATGDSNGQVKIAGSNVSVKGLGSAAYTNSTAYAAASHTHSGDAIIGGYLNIHPENSPILIPFMNNDIAYLLKRGGSVVIKYDNTTQSIDLTNVFDASPSYWVINPTGITTITIELTLHKQFSWENVIYVDFGASSWRAKTVKIEVMNSNYSDDTWSQKYNNTSNNSGHCYVTTSHTPAGASNAGSGFNKIRFTFSGWATSTIFRIAQLGVYNYGSTGLRETFLPKDGGPIFGSIYPNSNNGANLGTTTQYFGNAYITNINGVAVGSSPKFTDTNTWRPVGTGASDAAAGNHTHTLSLATDTGTSSITLAHGGKYKLTAGGSTYIFTMPSDNNTNYYHTTGSWGGTNSLTYTATANGGAGALAFTLPTASTSAYGAVKLVDSISNTSTTLAATANSVKTAYDLANKGGAHKVYATSNSSASDALTYGTAVTPVAGQVIFVTLTKATAGTANMTMKFGSNTAISIVNSLNTAVKAVYPAGTILQLVYANSKFYLLNLTTAL